METSDMIAAVHKYVEAFDKQDMAIIRDIYGVIDQGRNPSA